MAFNSTSHTHRKNEFEFCERYMEDEYGNFHETNLINLSAITRFCSMLLLVFFYIRNKRRAARSFGFASRFVILPSYFDYIGALIATYFLFGVFSLAGGSFRQLSIYGAIQYGVYHMFDEGLAFFLLQHGAGYYGMRIATLYAATWGAIVCVTFLIIFRAESNRPNNLGRVGLVGSLLIVCLIFLFYLAILLLPLKTLYRRPSIYPFALFKVLNMLMWISVLATLYLEFDIGYCLMFSCRTVVEGVVEPVIIFYTLILDSEFWQGFGMEAMHNPLAGVWDLHVETAAEMGKQLSEMEQHTRKLPIIHFGQIELDQHLGYVAGGLSRVYFGRIQKEMVAVKILFAMELTPKVVKAFYEEVQVLYQLQHENVVECLGVSVMPPAVCVILEYCQYGSLFDYLYKFPKISTPNRQMSKASVGRVRSWDISAERITELSAFSGQLRREKKGTHYEEEERPSTVDSLSSAPRHSSSVANPVLANHGGIEEIGTIRRSRASSVGLEGERMSVSHNERLKILLEKGNTGGNHRSIIGRLSMLGGKPNTEGIGGTWDQTSEAPFSTGESMRRTLTSRPAVDAPPVLGDEPKPEFTLRERLLMIIDACKGLEFLHMNGYIHCDLKSPNFLVSNNKVVKVADLGEARDYTSTTQYSRLPNPAINWRPPELLIPDVSLRNYSVGGDVYGLAMVISEILTQELPMDTMFRNSTPDECYHHLVAENRRPALPDYVPSPLREILTSAWTTNPSMRPSCGDIATVAIECLAEISA